MRAEGENLPVCEPLKPNKKKREAFEPVAQNQGKFITLDTVHFNWQSLKFSFCDPGGIHEEGELSSR